MKKIVLAATGLVGVLALAAPAMAAPVVNGVISNLGAAGFSYGSFNGATFASYNAYPAGASECLGLGACYRGDDTYAIIAQANASELLVHPGPGPGGNSAVLFTPGQAGAYRLSAVGTSADVGTKNVGYFTIIGGVTTFFTSGAINGNSSQQISDIAVLGANDSIGVFVNNFDGSYFNDSTRVSGTIGAVPEPATWAMMLMGFGMVGFGLRYRRKQPVRVSFA